MSENAWILMGMSERGHLPKVLARRSERFGTPVSGITVGTAVIVLLSLTDFKQLVEMVNFMYVLAVVMEFAAFVKLRYSRKHAKVERPYRAPISDRGTIVVSFFPIFMVLVLFCISSWLTIFYILTVVIIGVVLCFFQKAHTKMDCLH